jgi:tetratricopeptide (TPR) repeat protein
MRPSAATVLCVCATRLQMVAQDDEATHFAHQSWATLHGTAVLHYKASDFAEALDASEAALPLAITAEQRAMTASDIGFALSGLGRHVDAIAQFERSLVAWRDIDPAGHDAIRTVISLAKTQQALGRYAGAEGTLRTALEGPLHNNESRASVLNALGDLLDREARLAEARDTFEAALKISSLRSENRATALIGVADIDRCMRCWKASISRSDEALALARDVNDPVVEGLALMVLGNTWSDMADAARAEPLLKRALAIFERSSPEGLQYSATLASLGVVYAQEGKHALAEDALTRALGEGADAANSFNMGTLQFLAVLLAKEKRFGEAFEFANRAYGIALSAFGEDNPQVASALTAMAFVEDRAGNLDKAKHHYAEALRIMRKHDIFASTGGLEIMQCYAIVLRKLHRGREAKSVNAELKAFRSAAQPAH